MNIANGIHQKEIIKDSGITALYKYTRVNLHGFKLDSVHIAKGRRTKISLSSESDYVAWAKELQKDIGGHYFYNKEVIKNR